MAPGAPRAWSGAQLLRLPQPVETRGRKEQPSLCSRAELPRSSHSRCWGRGRLAGEAPRGSQVGGGLDGGIPDSLLCLAKVQRQILCLPIASLSSVWVWLRLRSPSSPMPWLGCPPCGPRRVHHHGPDVWMPGSRLSWAPLPRQASECTLPTHIRLCAPGDSSVSPFPVLP